MDADRTPSSPRLAALQQALVQDDAAALEVFWRELAQQGAPLIEPIADDSANLLVTFVWRGSEESEGVALVSNLNGQLGASEPLARLPGADVWFKTYRLPNDTRESYQFAMGEENRTDPLNSREFVFPGDPEIPFTGWVSSMFELPAAPPQPWITAQPSVPRGQVMLHRFASDALDQEYRVWVYTPPGYTTDGPPYGWLLMFDGWFYLDLAPAPTILDNLLAAGRLPPLVAILVGHPWDKHRRRDLACHPPFEQFLVDEIIPWARRTYHLIGNPGQTAVVGASLGGLMAAYMGLRHADVFGNVLAQSGHFGWKPSEDEEDCWLVRQVMASARLPLRFYVEAGRFETAIPSPLPGLKDFLASARRMRGALTAQGYDVHYSEFSGGHNPVCYRGSLADGLMALLGTNRT